VFHWSCFIALMKEHGETGAEQMTWKGSGAKDAGQDTANCNRGNGKL
jgi:hypothetical protein